MEILKKIGISAVLILLATVSVSLQERLSGTEDGYSFAVIKGWKSEVSGDGLATVNAARTVVVVVKGHKYPNFSAFWADAGLKRDGLVLAAEPAEIKGGRIFRSLKRTVQGTVVVDTSVLFSADGGGVVIVSLTNKANADLSWQAVLEISSTVQFTKPRVSPAAAQVRGVLSGKKLTYLYTGSGYSERKDIVLCSSGVFYQTTDMGGFSTNDVDGPSFAARGVKSGTWSIGSGGQKLMLSFQNGAVTEYTLSRRQASNEVGLNGARFFIQQQQMCN